MLARLERLLAELKRRHVFRMVGVYALGAWVVIQVAATTFPYLGIPQWTVTALIVAAAAGLVLTIALAWAFDLTSEGIRRDDADQSGRARPRGWRLVVPLLVLAAIVTGGGMAARAVKRARTPALDENLAAVMPFRVAGGGASQDGLGEGMVDLLALRLGGEQGMRAVDPRAVISRWRRKGGDDADDASEVATRIAREVGAARVITGSLVLTGSRVTIGATLLRTGERASGHSESVTGALDSLLYLVDGLAVALLAGDAGLETQRVGGLTSLPALQSYLAGKAAYRRGEYGNAVKDFEAALEADSAFALAALGLAQSAWRSPPDNDLARPAIDRAYRHLDRLGPRDQARFRAFAPVYPAMGTVIQNVTAYEQLLGRWPDDADAWFELGDQLLHFGRANEIPNSIARAQQAFNRALALDSTFNLPLEHLLLAAFELRDSATVRALAPRLFVLGATGDRTSFERWRVAIELADTPAVRAVEAAIDTLPPASIDLLQGDAVWLGTRLDAAERVVARYRREASSPHDLRWVMMRTHHLALNRGQVTRARELLDRLPADPDPRAAPDPAFLEDALFWDGDRAAADAAAARLESSAEPAPASGAERSNQARQQCLLGWWELDRGRASAAMAHRERLRRAPIKAEDFDFNPDDREYCGALIDAWIAATRRQRNTAQLIERADSIYIFGATQLYAAGNIITARLRETIGDRAGAFRAIRRTFVGANDQQQRFVSTYLRETARLAALQGDTLLARDYYRRYLSLRADADPSLQPDLDRVRAALAALDPDRRR